MKTLCLVLGTAVLLVVANVRAADTTDQAQDQSSPGLTPYQSENVYRGDQDFDQEQMYQDQGADSRLQDRQTTPDLGGRDMARGTDSQYPADQRRGTAGWDTQRIDQITGLHGRQTRSGVYILRVPPNITCLSVGGLRLPTSMAPASTVSFKRAGGTTLVSGDLLLLQNQVNPAIDAALNSGLQITGLHDAFLWDSPRVKLLHFTGTGDTNRLANAVSRILSSTGFRGPMGAEMREAGTYGGTTGGATCPESACPSSDSVCEENVNACEEGATMDGGTHYSDDAGACPPVNDGSSDLANSAVNPNQLNLDRRQIQNILATRGFEHNGVLKFRYPKITNWQGEQLGWAMGVKSEIAFAGSPDRAVVSGDFAVYPRDLQNVLRALRQANINILTIGSHLTGENPRVVFVHFLGTGRAIDLARGIRDAVEANRSGVLSRQFQQRGQEQSPRQGPQQGSQQGATPQSPAPESDF